jgi:hypothetical protein
MSLYTPNIKKIVRETRAPYRGLIVDVVEWPDYLELRVYKDNIESFSEPQKVALAEHLYRIRDAIRLTGTKCHLNGSLEPVPNKGGK